MADLNLNIEDGVNVSVGVTHAPGLDVGVITNRAVEVVINRGPSSTEAGGTQGQLQYNANGTFGGVAGTNYANGALTLGGVSAVKITGGSAGQTLSTDGTGNLSWITPSDANIANSANYAGNVTVSNQPNITSLGNLTALRIAGNITGNLLPNANITYDIGSSTQRWRDLYLSGNTIYLGAQTLTATANGVTLTGNITGDGRNLSNLAGANVTGVVANATNAVNATNAILLATKTATSTLPSD